MRVIRVSTTAHREEDFFLLTTLSDEMISSVINPIIKAEREGFDCYDNEDLFKALTYEYPLEKVIMYNDLETLVI